MENLSHKKRNFNHFCLKERQILENLLKQHYKVSAIAEILGKHRSSIYRQINNKANTDFVRFGKKVKHIFKTITFDNGSEFAKVFNLESKDLHIYFTHPYSSFEKGGVENYNGWIRRYIPKGTDMSKISREKIQAINSQINNVPRKILNYRTPAELFEIYLDSITA